MKVIDKNNRICEGKFEETWVKRAFWHTSAHMLAQAVKRLYPDTVCAIGGISDQGFYYDFQFSFAFGYEHLYSVEKEMKKIAKEAFTVSAYERKKEEAAVWMQKQNENYKLQILQEDSDNGPVSFYKQGEYVECCMGSHISNTCHVKAIQLLSIAGAYWRGNEKNKMLTRIYGISFPKRYELECYLSGIEAAKQRDHRKLGKELGLFTIFEQGPGFPVFLPKGMILKNLLIEFWREIHRREGYMEISTPIILDRNLWEISGHWDHYREIMYGLKIDETEFAIKPMSCPGGMLVYKSKPRSYRELPLKLGELGLVHRNEKSGTLHGLMRARAFTQDDAHIFMMENQMCDEIQAIARMIGEVYGKFGFEYSVELSTRPKSSIGTKEEWERATSALKNAMDAIGVTYTVNEGDGAFYGPKLDFHLKDSLGRTWQCGTIQLDFQLPKRFQAEYTGADGKAHCPVMIHRVIFGSIERFIGILIEHYGGKFPLWLSPVQVKILLISERFMPYVEKVSKELEKAGIRFEIDDRTEKIGYKIREAQLDKVPYMIIIGQKEMEEERISVRKRDQGDLGNMSVLHFIQSLQSEVREKQ